MRLNKSKDNTLKNVNSTFELYLDAFLGFYLNAFLCYIQPGPKSI